jgi:hypothetical protein
MMAVLAASTFYLKQQQDVALESLGEQYVSRQKKSSGTAARYDGPDKVAAAAAAMYDGPDKVAAAAAATAEKVHHERDSPAGKPSSADDAAENLFIGQPDGADSLHGVSAVAHAGFNAQELCNLFWALSKLHYAMIAEEAVGSSSPKSGRMIGDHVKSRRLQRALKSWISTTESVAISLLPLCDAQDVSNLLVGSVRFLHMKAPDPALVAGAVDRLNSLILSKVSRDGDLKSLSLRVLRLSCGSMV